jgi:sulfite exporter TauE/SafE
MELELVALFTIGFLGGFGHCIGMCGGFVMTYTLKLQTNETLQHPSRWQTISPHLLYNAGRVFTYVVLGQIFGLLGSTLGVVLAIRDFQGILELFAGAIMMLMGLDLAGLLSAGGSDSFPGISSFKKLVHNMFNRVNRKNIFVLGMVMGLIPCGLVYAAGAKAAATQSMVGGMLSMLAFGLGTFPAMVITGLAVHLISAKLRRILYRVAAFMVFLLGVLTVLRGIDALGWIKFYWLF